MDKPHFLVVTYPVQGHINPALHLATRLSQIAGAHITFSTAVSAHRRMFPSSATHDQEIEDGPISYMPYSDGYDDGFKDYGDKPKVDHFMSQSKQIASRNLSNLVVAIAARSHPVTCIIYTLFSPWVAGVARHHKIPSILYWIQSAAVFASFYHYFHGYDGLVKAHRSDPLFTVNLPGLPPIQIRDLPSFLTISADDTFYSGLVTFHEVFAAMDGQQTWPKPKVLVNTFNTLEVDGLAAVDEVDLITVGPLLPSEFKQGKVGKKEKSDLFEPDEKAYMEWLDSKPERSVVYVSFGSVFVVKKRQFEEMLWGLKECGRPYLWVVRKDNRGEGILELEEEENGMVVEWCSQVKVLSHRSVGCFVTHCGWNSTLESLASGVPTVAVPQMADQRMNAKLTEEAWGTGIRGVVNEEGVLEGNELGRCLEVVMGEGQKGEEIRRRAEMWRDRAREAIGRGGSSDQNLRTFVKEVTKFCGLSTVDC
ncbi:Crocetin glucosyltransferase, chloroplastic [Cocos nucifera]|uniref:Glycosyltransferase n=1 Tax=Cocos nucifera TaxID=13894 RepID=A0A8K0I441_COCNU|nr:Crocetin glucosyltransferase, chloroplastic [Cocos nucifera]KAG1335493.1 Crocetin glucosyltransferase, chloroplastic [Cocos nucifera]